MGNCARRIQSDIPNQQTYQDIINNYTLITEKLVNVSSEIKQALNSIHIINNKIETLETKAKLYEEPKTNYDKIKYIENQQNIYKNESIYTIKLPSATKNISKKVHCNSNNPSSKSRLQDAREKFKKFKKIANEEQIDLTMGNKSLLEASDEAGLKKNASIQNYNHYSGDKRANTPSITNNWINNSPLLSHNDLQLQNSPEPFKINSLRTPLSHCDENKDPLTYKGSGFNSQKKPIQPAISNSKSSTIKKKVMFSDNKPNKENVFEINKHNEKSNGIQIETTNKDIVKDASINENIFVENDDSMAIEEDSCGLIFYSSGCDYYSAIENQMEIKNEQCDKGNLVE